MLFRKREVVETGAQKGLTTKEIQTNPLNPRQLFDGAPMSELLASIREHGVLVPLTVYLPAGNSRYVILDGERRYRCCLELEQENGQSITVPCNVVQPPNPVANLVYMFAIHKFRLDWELMPTARSLDQLIVELNKEGSFPTDRELRTITGLSQTQIDRCMVLMRFPKDLQDLSLLPDPKKRIPSNFWFEMYPVLNLIQSHLPNEVLQHGDLFQIARIYTSKYQAGKIKSVTEFRKVRGAFAGDGATVHTRQAVAHLKASFEDIDSSISELFNQLNSTARDVNNLLESVNDLSQHLSKVAPDLITDVQALRDQIQGLYSQLGAYLEQLGDEAPAQPKP